MDLFTVNIRAKLSWYCSPVYHKTYVTFSKSRVKNTEAKQSSRTGKKQGWHCRQIIAEDKWVDEKLLGIVTMNVTQAQITNYTHRHYIRIRDQPQLHIDSPCSSSHLVKGLYVFKMICNWNILLKDTDMCVQYMGSVYWLPNYWMNTLPRLGEQIAKINIASASILQFNTLHWVLLQQWTQSSEVREYNVILNPDNLQKGL